MNSDALVHVSSSCVCGSDRSKSVLNETSTLIQEKLCDEKGIAKQLANLLKKPRSENKDEAAMDQFAVKRVKQLLNDLKEDTDQLQKFLDNLHASWADADQRRIGWVDWAPKICNNMDDHGYTRDIGVIELDKPKWEKAFRGNCVYLGGKYTRHVITSMFNDANCTSFKYLYDHLYKIQGYVSATDLKNPYLLDSNGSPCYIVAKDGQTTGLTFGRYSPLEAYTCNEFDKHLWELAIFNFDKATDNFSGKGDSGSLIFNAEGKMVAFLHSGLVRESSTHVTYSTPAYFVIEQVLKRYPHADFSRVKF